MFPAISSPATLLEAVLHIVERERKRKGKKDITCTTKTNIGPEEISPSRPHPRRSSCRRRLGGGTMRIFEITSRQASFVSLLDKTYFLKYGRSR